MQVPSQDLPVEIFLLNLFLSMQCRKDIIIIMLVVVLVLLLLLCLVLSIVIVVFIC